MIDDDLKLFERYHMFVFYEFPSDEFINLRVQFALDNSNID